MEIMFNTKYKQDRSKLKMIKDYGVSLTKQSDAKDADINNIMKKYVKTGILPQMISADPKYGDFSEAGDYLESIQLVMHAEEQFLALPAHVRKKFDNNPASFLEFVHNPENEAEMIDLGLKEKPAGEAQASQGKGEPSSEPKSEPVE